MAPESGSGEAKDSVPVESSITVVSDSPQKSDQEPPLQPKRKWNIPWDTFPNDVFSGGIIAVLAFLAEAGAVDGTLIEAWASHKSFRPKHQGPPIEGCVKVKNPDTDFRNEKRSNGTHASTTDPDVRL
jgi:hypothetical protein